MKLNIEVSGGRASVSTIPESSNPAGLNINVNTDSLVKVADTVLSYMYDEHSPFRGGFSKVKKGELYGYVNLALEECVSPEYSRAYDVCEGYAKVLRDGKYHFIEMTGFNYLREVDIPGFDEADDVHNGMARVKTGGKYGFFSASSNTVKIPCEYENAVEFDYRRAYTAVKKDGKWGLVAKDGSVILEPVFDSISLNGNRFDAEIGDVKYTGGPDGKYEEKK